MEVSQKKVTREALVNALNAAALISSKKHPRTKLAYYCDQFTELNKELSKDHNKKSRKIVAPLELELNSYRVDKASEKDSIIMTENIVDSKDKIHTKYKYSKENEKLVLKKESEITDKINDLVDQFMMEEVEVKVIVSELKLPDDIDPVLERELNGFVFQNKNAFEEEINETK